MVDVNKLNGMCLTRFTLDNNEKKYKVIQHTGYTKKKCMIVSGVKGSNSGSTGGNNATTLTMVNVSSLLVSTLCALLFKQQL